MQWKSTQYDLLEAAVAEMTRSFVVRVFTNLLFGAGFVDARPGDDGNEEALLFVTGLMCACWSARCCLQARLRYLVKFAARVGVHNVVCKLWSSLHLT